MAETANRIIHIVPIGAEGQLLTILKVAANLLAGMGIDAACCKSEKPSEGEVHIIDCDAPGADEAIQAHFDDYAALIGTSEPASKGPNHRFEQKPVRVQTLAELLHGVITAYFEAGASKPAVKAAAPATILSDLPKIDTTAARSLFEVILAAKQAKKAYKINGIEAGAVLVNPASSEVAFTIDKAQLIAMAKKPAADFAVSDLSTADYQSEAATMQKLNLGVLLWNMAIMGRLGDLPPGHSDDTPVKLRAWPNFTRLGVGSNHINLTAILARQPMSLAKLVEVARVPRESAASFYNGAYAIGLLSAARDGGAGVESANQPTEKRRGLFAKIASKLALARGE